MTPIDKDTCEDSDDMIFTVIFTMYEFKDLCGPHKSKDNEYSKQPTWATHVAWFNK